MIGSVHGARTLILPATGRASGVALAIASMSTIQLGAALSEPLFDRVGPAGLVALRLVFAALILWPFVRPRVRGRRRADLGAAVALGACSGLLTLAFFEAIARIPLGVAVTVEFLGPLGVALAGSRHARDVAWVLLAGAGVALLTLGHGAGSPSTRPASRWPPWLRRAGRATSCSRSASAPAGPGSRDSRSRSASPPS